MSLPPSSSNLSPSPFGQTSSLIPDDKSHSGVLSRNEHGGPRRTFGRTLRHFYNECNKIHGFDLTGYHRLFGGAPSVPVYPSDSASSFTCFVFSSDGAVLALGELNGNVRICDTKNYTCSPNIELARDEKNAAHDYTAISAMAFLDGNDRVLSVVQRSGRIFHLTKTTAGSSTTEAAGSSTTEETKEQSKIHLYQKGEPTEVKGKKEEMYARMIHQFSTDGRTLAFYDWDKDTEEYLSQIVLYRFVDNESSPRELMLQLDSGDPHVPILSKDGQRLLVCGFASRPSRNNESDESDVTSWVSLYPQLDFEAQTGQSRIDNLEGQRATWGRDGQYLLVWTSTDKAPQLAVYETALIGPEKESQKPLATLNLCLGLQRWSAQMLEPGRDESDVKVLTSEISFSGKTRFVIWDVTQKAILHEVSMPARSRELPMTQLRITSFQGTPPESIIYGDLPPKTSEAYRHLVVSDAFPAFCISKDCDWIGAFAWNTQSAGICCVRSGATVWRCDVPGDCSATNPLILPTQAFFDESRLRFIVISDSVVLAIAPAFLNTQDQSQLDDSPLGPLVAKTSKDSETSTLEAYKAVSSKAIVKTWQTLHDAGTHELLFQRTRDHKDNETFFFLDAAVSHTGSFVVYLPNRNHLADSVLIVWKKRSDHDNSVDSNDYSQFADESFLPNRIFLYRSENVDEESADEDCMVLLSVGEHPKALFTEILSSRWFMVDLLESQITICLEVCQTSDHQKIAILDFDGVIFLDLRSKRLTGRVPYAADTIKHLVDKIHERMSRKEDTEARSNRVSTHKRRPSTERRIADDGRVILLAWDVKNGRSVTIRPEMSERTCNKLVEAADAEFSEFCTLTADGACTLFLHMESRQNKITVGTFNEKAKQTVSRIHVLSVGMIRDNDKEWTLSNIYYGLCRNGTRLVTVTSLHQTLMPPHDARDKIRTFSVYSSAEGVPSYHRLHLEEPERERFEAKLKEMVGKSGCFVVNVMSSNGLSFLQEAALARDWDCVSTVMECASIHGSHPSLEWNDSVSGETQNLLQWAMETKSANDISNVLDKVLCNPQAPFCSVARIMKHAFRPLLVDHREILENILAKNLLITDACDVDVHVEFMNPQEQENHAVHITTSPTFLEWKHVESKAAQTYNWRSQNMDTVSSMEKRYRSDESTESASLKYISIEDAAMPGTRGIIRPMLLQAVPEHYFEFEVVKWIVLFKWFKIWKKRYFMSAFCYIIFFLSFAAYTILVAASDHLDRESESKKIALSVLISMAGGFGVWKLWKVGVQTYTRMMDSKQYKESIWKGLYYYIHSYWNIIDLLFCVLLESIVLFHFISMVTDSKTVEEVLTALIAAESIVATFKLWYFAKPFRRSGPLVVVINGIVRNSAVFLLLSLCILVGFGLALHVSFRHTGIEDEPSSNSERSVAEECRADVDEAYGKPHRSLLTLFYALVGTFNEGVYMCPNNLSWLTTGIFVSYMIAQMIILLNLLIAIMGDTYDRIRSTEDAQLLLGRAHYIDMAEAALTPKQLKHIESETSKYIRFLDRKKETSSTWPRLRWTGKLNRIENFIREAKEEANTKTEEILTKLEEQLQIQEEQHQHRIEESRKREEEYNRRLQTMSNQLTEVLTQLYAVLPSQPQPTVVASQE